MAPTPMVLPSVQQLVDSGIHEVPSAFVRPPHDRPLRSSAVSSDITQIPVIDLERSSSCGDLLSALAKACEEWGFFQVVNHGVHQEIIDGMREACHAFFSLPEEQRNIYRSQDFYAPLALFTSFNSSSEKTRDWRDALYVRDLAGKARNGFDMTPSMCRKAFQIYREEVEKLANVLYIAIFESLGLSHNYLKEALPGMPRLVLAANYYPSCPDPTVTFGLTGHSDVGLLTILLQDDVPGLQVKKGERWIEVKPMCNAFVINLGDQIQLLTNGKYKSVEHRVVTNSQKSRLSVACFFGPSEDTKIAPLKELISDKKPALYKEVMFGDYVRNLFSRGLLPDRATLDFAKATS